MDQTIPIRCWFLQTPSFSAGVDRLSQARLCSLLKLRASLLANGACVMIRDFYIPALISVGKIPTKTNIFVCIYI